MGMPMAAVTSVSTVTTVATVSTAAVPFVFRERILMDAISLKRRVELSKDLNLEGRMGDAHLLRHYDASLQSLRSMVRAIDHHVTRTQHILGTHRPHV